jgi:hypothetical protein
MTREGDTGEGILRVLERLKARKRAALLEELAAREGCNPADVKLTHFERSGPPGPPRSDEEGTPLSHDEPCKAAVGGR